MKAFSNAFKRVLCIILYVALGHTVYANVPPFVSWHISDFPEVIHTSASTFFIPYDEKILCWVNMHLYATEGKAESTYYITDGVSNLPGNNTIVEVYNSHGYYSKYYPGNVSGLGRSNFTPGNDELFWSPEPGSQGNYIAPLAVVGGYLLFVHERSLWRTDGSHTGTEQIYDFSATYDTYLYGRFIRGMVIEEDYLYFIAGPSTGTHGLWRTDGTTEGTINLLQRSNAPLSILAADGGIVFFTERPSTGAWLWRTNGTTQGTQQIASFPFQSMYGSSFIISSSYANGRLWFGLNPQNELWYSDGTTAGTRKVTTFPTLPPGYGRQMDRMQAVGDSLLLTASEGDYVHYLWRSDGTEQGTLKLIDPESGDGWSNVFFYGTLEENVLFGGYAPAHRIWVSDGTAMGTRMLSDTLVTFTSPRKFRDHYLMLARSADTPTALWGLREDAPFQFRTQPKARQYYYENDPLHLFVEVPSWYESTASYQWFKNNAPLEGENANELYIGMLTLADSGRYFCRVTLDDKIVFHDSAVAHVRVFEEGSLPLGSLPTFIIYVVLFCLFATLSIIKCRRLPLQHE